MTFRLPFTSEPLNSLLRGGCIAVYLAAGAGALGLLPPPWAAPAVSVGVFVVAAHTLELLLLRRHLGLHPGTPGQAVVLALLFGSLHWFPLLEERRRKQPVKA